MSTARPQPPVTTSPGSTRLTISTAAMAFIALTTTSRRDAGVRVRLLAAAGVVALGVAGALVALPAAVVAAGVFAVVAGLTTWQERRTAA